MKRVYKNLPIRILIISIAWDICLWQMMKVMRKNYGLGQSFGMENGFLQKMRLQMNRKLPFD